MTDSSPTTPQGAGAEQASGHIVNCHGQRIHPDATVILGESDRRSFGGARFIDAETFVKMRPLSKLIASFVAGQWATQDTQTGIIMDVPAAYAANGWK